MTHFEVLILLGNCVPGLLFSDEVGELLTFLLLLLTKAWPDNYCQIRAH